MLAIKQLLVVIDPTAEKDFALERARLIAKATGARVNLFINCANSLNENSYLYEGIDPEFFKTQYKLFTEHYQQILAKAAAEFSADGITTTTEFQEHHNLAEAIIRQATAIGADLLIKSTHHHSAVSRVLITNTDWRLIRKCPVPLFLVKPKPWLADGTIVTAVDPLHAKAEQGQLDHVLLETTETLSKNLDSTPCVFHSYFPFVSSLFSSSPQLETSLDRIRAQHAEKLQALLAGHAIAESNIKLSVGELVPSLIAYLNEARANLLVIGALSRNVIERAIVGDTAQKILEDCPCDVLVMKSGKSA